MKLGLRKHWEAGKERHQGHSAEPASLLDLTAPVCARALVSPSPSHGRRGHPRGSCVSVSQFLHLWVAASLTESGREVKQFETRSTFGPNSYG